MCIGSQGRKAMICKALPTILQWGLNLSFSVHVMELDMWTPSVLRRFCSAICWFPEKLSVWWHLNCGPADWKSFVQGLAKSSIVMYLGTVQPTTCMPHIGITLWSLAIHLKKKQKAEFALLLAGLKCPRSWNCQETHKGCKNSKVLANPVCKTKTEKQDCAHNSVIVK